MSRYEPRRDSAARIRQKWRHGDRPGRADAVLALVGECCAVASLPCAADVTAELAAGPTEGRNHRRRLPQREIGGGGRTDCGQRGKRYASEQKLFHVEPLKETLPSVAPHHGLNGDRRNTPQNNSEGEPTPTRYHRVARNYLAAFRQHSGLRWRTAGPPLAMCRSFRDISFRRLLSAPSGHVKLKSRMSAWRGEADLP